MIFNTKLILFSLVAVITLSFFVLYHLSGTTQNELPKAILPTIKKSTEIQNNIGQKETFNKESENHSGESKVIEKKAKATLSKDTKLVNAKKIEKQTDLGKGDGS